MQKLVVLKTYISAYADAFVVKKAEGSNIPLAG